MGAQYGEPLEKHLRAVATRAAGFAAPLGAAEWGRLAGLWHDIGKWRPEFQAYLRGRHPGVEHAGVGAALAAATNAPGWVSLALVIAGHHAGLANRESNIHAEQNGFTVLPTPLSQRLKKNEPVLHLLHALLPAEIAGVRLPPLPAAIEKLLGSDTHRETTARAIEFWTRMLFSTLVDADRIETARFYARYEPALIHADLDYDSIASLRNRLDADLDTLELNLCQPSGKRTSVNRLRSQVLRACRKAAAKSLGRFSLTVPTGGGKTLAAMSFALNHAHPRGSQERLHRVIVVIPYTSIIEQNAAIYRRVLGDGNVLEHHSNLDEMKLEEHDTERETRRKLAAENWDAPVVVTTSVQFFESLFSNHPSRCRKLHRIAQSVILLDEVQTLPPQLLEPILDGLRELTERYDCSIVLSTATPPALVKRTGQTYGLEGVHEVVPDPTGLANRARRVRVHWEVGAPASYDLLALRIAAHLKALTIVHLRRDARVLAELVEQTAGAEGLFHLSALMCPAHRLEVLERVRTALAGEGPCRLIATQLVEAGVDVDFPIVFRALCGLDSVAQAAGRCDREGLLTEARGGDPGGELIVFRAPTEPPPGVLRKAMESTITLLGLRGELDPFDPETCQDFFRELYGKHNLDDRAIQFDRQNLDFATVAAKFRMIDSAMRPIVVPYGDAVERVEAFRRAPSRRTQRALQPFIVQVSPSHHEALRAAGAIEAVDERVEVLAQPFWSRYSDRFGLDPQIDGVMDAEVAIV
ncbi:MAG: CRISPR-associated endonuclease Cas3'' [Phycisphaerales bacterium]|nr:CRISPR-associated endonuclease Cas3'' [Phycisphaerales bacterium]MCI0631511.1 CRISPR-associated endonuclease Cas3'' [Phycisphaerales bacterium]